MTMPKLLRLAGLLVASATLGTPALADVAPPPPAEPLTCEAAGVLAEQRWGLPPGLLAAIGRMESGRADPATGRVAAWPWSINAAGTDGVFATRAAAIDAVLGWQMRGVRSIDVGCFQINLLYHPDAFATLEEGFDARANADYAARFLSDLHTRGGSWERAVAWYHSATPGVGERYRDRVLADWSGGGLRILPLPPPGEAPVATAFFQRTTTALTNTGTARDPYVVLASLHAGGMRIWMPSQAALPAAPLAGPPASGLARPAVRETPARFTSFANRLPRIVTPRG